MAECPLRRDDLLIEIGCEELPPRSLDSLRGALFHAVCDGLEKQQIAFDRSTSRAYSSPRRLALLIGATAESQPDTVHERRGPAAAAAFDALGKPTPAAIGFARSAGLEVEQLVTIETDKGSWLSARVHQAGRPLAEVLYPVLEQALTQLPVPRPMRWASHDFSFVRPVHWLLVLHGSTLVPGRLLGQTAGTTTHGHRVHSPGPHPVPAPRHYLEVLREACVLADPAERRQAIRTRLVAADPRVRLDEALLDEVNNLVEWPQVLVCSFHLDFLEIPHEVLIASMQEHQKFFPVRMGKDELITNRFLAVANLESTDSDRVREGFERVVRPRLADARFFLEQDRKTSLDALRDLLDAVVFQQKVGSIGDKVRRMTALSKNLAEKLAENQNLCERAAQLAKCDLLTQMVGEFPELQGTMGRYYALDAGEPEAVAAAIEQHYWPRFAGDRIPLTPAARIVSLADRADTLVAIFAAGQRPSGNRDPFALRRAALGLVRILLEAAIELPLERLLAMAANQLAEQCVRVQPDTLAAVREFIAERARHHFRDAGHAAELVNAAMASNWHSLPDLDARLRALAAFMGDETGLSLAAANKRIGNILRKSDTQFQDTIDENLLRSAHETDLFNEIREVESTLVPLLDRADYAACLTHLARLRPSVDAFFDAVLVMDEDLELRRNRLALLARLKGQFDRIADLSVLG